MITLSRAVLQVIEAGTPLPPDLTNEAAVKAYLDGLTGPMAKLIATVAEAVQSSKIGLIGASPEEIRKAVAEELEGRALVGVNPAVIEAIVTIILFIISQLRKQ